MILGEINHFINQHVHVFHMFYGNKLKSFVWMINKNCCYKNTFCWYYSNWFLVLFSMEIDTILKAVQIETFLFFIHLIAW